MLQLASCDIAIIGGYLIVVLVVGVLLTRRAAKNMESYFLGGRNLPWWILGASGMISNLDMTGTMVITSFFFILGIKGFWVALRGGVALSLAFLMIFMGKWHRRSKAMTTAEWMEFRFGTGPSGQSARLVSAITITISTIGMVAYLTVGSGKFLSMFLPFSPHTCALILISVAGIYVIASGLYGVVFTDLIQAVVVGAAAIYISFIAFTTVDPNTLANTPAGWESLAPLWHISMPAGYEIYEMFGLCILLWVIKAISEGFGGPSSSYTSQRYYAARSDRECGLLTGLWTALFTLRWPMMIGIAMLGLTISGSIQDPEMTLPTVIGHCIPIGFRGLIVAALIAAAMSTFDSTVNAGAAYVVKDIFQRFIRLNASAKELAGASYLASAFIIVVGVTIGFMAPSIDVIWSWLTMGLFAGLFVPLLLRWYWWRFNGWGFAVGTATGLVAAIFQILFFSHLPIYMSFPTVAFASLMGSIGATLATQPTEEEVLINFYKETRPFGAWSRFKNKINPHLQEDIKGENRRDILNLCLAIPWQISLFLTPMNFIMHNWIPGIYWLVLFLSLSICLYLRWYKALPA